MWKYPSGSRGRPAKALARISVARVQIPPSTPYTVKRIFSLDGIFLWLEHKGFEGRQAKIFWRRSAESTADLTAIGFCCQPCAPPKAQIPPSTPYTVKRIFSLDGIFLWLEHKGFEGRQAKIFWRRSAESTADLTAIGFCCQPCAPPKAQIPPSTPYTVKRIFRLTVCL